MKNVAKKKEAIGIYKLKPAWWNSNYFELKVVVIFFSGNGNLQTLEHE